MCLRSTISGSARCRWPTRALSPAGGSAATCWDRITSTTCAIRGAATRSTLPTSTTSRSITTGRAAITRRRIRSTSGVRRRRPTSRSITRRRNSPGIRILERREPARGVLPHHAGPAFMRQRHEKPRVEALRSEGVLNLAVELPLDHGGNQPCAEAGTAAAFGGRALALLPVERQGQAAGGAGEEPGHLGHPRALGKASVLVCIRGKLVGRHGQAEGCVRIEED